MTYIYGLQDPVTLLIRYVGKANNPKDRFRKHIGEALNGRVATSYKRSWIMNLLSKGLTPELIILEQVPKSEWANAEEFWIAYLKCYDTPLVNLTAGGNGTTSWNPTPEQRAQMSKIAKEAMNRPEVRAKLSEKAFGRVVLPEVKRRHSERMKGTGNSMYGRKHSEESKRKMSENAIGHRPEFKERMKYNNPMANPESAVKMRKSLTGRKLTEEHKRNIAAGLLRRKMEKINEEK